MIKIGQTVKFKTTMGISGEAEVEDFTEFAVVVISPIFGRLIINHSEIISNNIHEMIVPTEDQWEYSVSFPFEDQSKIKYETNKQYGQYGYLSPDVDDDGC